MWRFQLKKRASEIKKEKEGGKEGREEVVS